MTDFWSGARACLIHVNFMNYSWILEGRKGLFLFVSSTLIPSEVAHFVTSPALPFRVHISQRMSPVCVSTSKLYEAGKCIWFLSTSLMSTEVSVAVKTEERNHKPGVLQRIMRGGEVKLSVHTQRQLSLELVYVKVFTQPWSLELPKC